MTVMKYGREFVPWEELPPEDRPKTQNYRFGWDRARFKSPEEQWAYGIAGVTERFPHLQPLRRLWGLIGMPEEQAPERIDAIMALPPQMQQALREIDDDQIREEAIELTVEAHRAKQELERVRQEAQQCEECGRPYVPASDFQKYCSHACRARAWRRSQK